ncbi:DMP19 family protein [Aquimarina sp. M1]
MSDIREKFEKYSFETVDKLFDTFGGDLNKLSDEEREVVRIWRLEADMYNGGFIQFFCNWGYDNFIETQRVLEKIKAIKSLDLITECEKIISKLKDDERVKELWDIPKFLPGYLTESENNRLDELDELYWTNVDDIQKIGYEIYLKK